MAAPHLAETVTRRSSSTSTTSRSWTRPSVTRPGHPPRRRHGTNLGLSGGTTLWPPRGREVRLLAVDERDLSRARAMADASCVSCARRIDPGEACRVSAASASRGAATRSTGRATSSQRRRGDVHGQGQRQGRLRGLRPGMHAAIRDRDQPARDLERGRLDEPRLVYQPIVELATRRTPAPRRCPLGPPHARHDPAGEVHRDRRGERRDPADRSLGPPRGLPPDRCVAT